MTIEDEAQQTRRGRRAERRGLAPKLDEEASSRLMRLALDGIPDTKKWAKKRSSRKVRRLEDMAIVCWVGKNGSGKSAGAVLSLLGALRGKRWHCEEPSHMHNDPILDENGDAIACGPNAVHDGWRRILSTVELTIAGTDTPHPLYDRLTSYGQLRDAEHCDIFLDEATGIVNARDSMSLPRPIQVKLDQLRKVDCRMIVTAPSFQRMDTTVRTVAEALILCTSYLSEPRPKDSVAVTAWRRKRLFRCRVFDAQDFEEFHVQQARQDQNRKHRLRSKFILWWWGPSSEVFPSYSSKGAVAQLGQTLDSGVCIDCGGRRTAPRCSCDH